MANMRHPFDSRLEHRAVGSAAVTATATLHTETQRAAQRTAYRTVIDTTAIKISANDELYQFVVELSDDNFTTVNAVAACLDMGATEVRQSGAPDSAAADGLELMWATEANGTTYQYWRVRVIISGTSPSITFNCYSTILGDV